MNSSKVLRYLIKIERWSCWFLFVLLILFFVSGYSVAGMYGFEKIMSKRLALTIHSTLHIPTLVLFAIHMAIRLYFTIKRWSR